MNENFVLKDYGNTVQVESPDQTSVKNMREQNSSNFLKSQWKAIHRAFAEFSHSIKDIMDVSIVFLTILMCRLVFISVDIVLNWRFLEETLRYGYATNVAYIASKILIAFTILSTILYVFEILAYIVDAYKKSQHYLDKQMTAGIVVAIILLQELPLTILVLLIANYGQNCSFDNTVLYTLIAKIRLGTGVFIFFYRMFLAHKFIHKHEGIKGNLGFSLISLLTLAGKIYLFVLVFIPSLIHVELAISLNTTSILVTDTQGLLAKTSHFKTSVQCSKIMNEYSVESIFDGSDVDIHRCLIHLHFHLDSKQKNIHFVSAIEVQKTGNVWLCSNALNYGSFPIEARAENCIIPHAILDNNLDSYCFNDE